jgi:hypothetical protein
LVDLLVPVLSVYPSPQRTSVPSVTLSSFQVLSYPLSPELAGFMILNESAVLGGVYNWRLEPGDDPNVPPDFDGSGLYRWREAPAGGTAFFARPISEGDWGVGCWKDQGQRETLTVEQVSAVPDVPSG